MFWAATNANATDKTNKTALMFAIFPVNVSKSNSNRILISICFTTCFYMKNIVRLHLAFAKIRITIKVIKPKIGISFTMQMQIADIAVFFAQFWSYFFVVSKIWHFHIYLFYKSKSSFLATKLIHKCLIIVNFARLTMILSHNHDISHIYHTKNGINKFCY